MKEKKEEEEDSSTNPSSHIYIARNINRGKNFYGTSSIEKKRIYKD
jgi:hypothetical protein